MKIRFTLLLAAAIVLLAACNEGRNYEAAEGDPMKTRIYTLSNGLKVYLSVNKDQPRIQANIAVRTGSRNDPAETTGLAHYLEHLMFKGTNHFGTTNPEAEAPLLDEIEQRFEDYRRLSDPEARRLAYHQIDSLSQLAAQYNIPNEYDKLMAFIGSEGSNAFTSFDETCYVENIPANELENWAKVQADRFQNMVIRGFHTELEAVYEEYNLYLSDDSEKAFNALLYKLLPTHPYGTQTTIGTQEHLKNPSITNIKRYFHNYYCPNNIAICMSGDLDPEQTMDILEQYFGDWQPNPDCTRPEYAPVPALTAPVDTTVVGLESETLLLGWSFPGASNHACDTLTLVSELLSNGKAGLIDLDINQGQAMLGAYAADYSLADYSLFLLGGSPRQGQTLEEARTLLLAEVDRLKRGDFPDDLLPAIINNLKLQQMQSLEDNSARVALFQNAFIQGIDWQDAVDRTQRIASLTKEDVVAFARRHLSDRYVTVFKRKGIDHSLKKIDKPHITAIPANRDKVSEFVRTVQETRVKPIAPRFVDFSKDLTVTETSGGQPLAYKQNTENGIFSLSFRLPFGTAAMPLLQAAAGYLDLLATDSLSAEQIQRQFYGLACNFSVSCGPYQTTIHLGGLDENLPQALALAQHVISRVQPDRQAYTAFVDNVAKSEADNKLEQRACFAALTQYGIYGPRNRQTCMMNAAQMADVNPQDVTDLIHSLFSYQHTVLYYGPRTQSQLSDLLADVLPKPQTQQPTPAYSDYMEQPTPQNEVLLAPYDAKNIYMTDFNNEQQPFSTDDLPVAALFNEYFGSGMNGIVFQELRESRGLAYRASAYYDATPERKGHPQSNYTHIITQNDKMADCIQTFNLILDTLPQSQASFQIAKESLLKQLSCQRTTRSAVLNAWLAARERGVDYDLNQRIYDGLPALTLDDIVRFASDHMARKPRRYIILGNEHELDMAILSKLGPIRRVSLEDIFGY